MWRIQGSIVGWIFFFNQRNIQIIQKILRLTCLTFIYSGNLEKKESSKDSSLFSKPGKRISTTLIPIKRKNTDSGSQKDLDEEKPSAGGGRRITTTLTNANRKDKNTTSSKDTEKEKELIKDENENKAEQDVIDENSDLEEETIEGVEEHYQIDQFDVKGKNYINFLSASFLIDFVNLYFEDLAGYYYLVRFGIPKIFI